MAANYVVGLFVERGVDRGDRRGARVAAGDRRHPQRRAAGLVQVRELRRRPGERGARRLRGRPRLPWTSILLPIGISFYTFHSLSY